MLSKWQFIQNYWNSHRALTALVAYCCLALVVSVLGAVLDPKIINGQFAWIKPVKFSISLAVYAMTLIWLSRFLTKNKQLFDAISAAALIGAVCELTAITVQVVRGTTSHFNTSTPFNHAMHWITIGSIMPVAFGIIAVYVMLLREEKLPPVMGTALKWGLAITIVGFIPGILMVMPDHLQDAVTAHKQFDGHTIGFSEGGPGLLLLGWSTVAGDLRAAHFAGIHALQILPLVGFAISKLFARLTVAKQQLLVWNHGVTYLAFICLLTWQAVSAESVVSPSTHTVFIASVLIVVSLITAACIVLVSMSSQDSPAGALLLPDEDLG